VDHFHVAGFFFAVCSVCVELFVGRETGAAEAAGESSDSYQRKYRGTECKGMK